MATTATTATTKRQNNFITDAWAGIPQPVKTGLLIFGLYKGYKWYQSEQEKIKLKKQQEQMQALYQMYYQQQQNLPGAPGGTPGLPGVGFPGAPGGALTYSPQTYLNWADTIEESLSTSFGEDWDTVLDIFKKVKTINDYQALDTAFGERTNYRFGIPTYTSNMVKWITDEMPTYKAKINQALATNFVPVQL